jgi:hypothetical protein
MVNNLLFEDELKRIGFIMNYDSKKLVSENIESSKNLVVENKINNLFSTPTTTTEIITETTLRKIFNEQWDLKKENDKKSLTEQWVKGADQVFYWKVLFDQLKAAGVGVKWEVANDPVKSTFMYWGSWVIWKDVNKNGGWPISFSGTNKKLWLFKFKGGKYAGQPAATMVIESKYINSTFNLGQWGKSSGAAAQLDGLIKTKPKSASTAQACKTVDGKPIAPNQIPTVAAQIFKDLAYAFDGAGTYEEEAVTAYKQITCKPILDAVNAKVAARGMQGIKNVGDWAKDEMSDYDYTQFRAIWAGLQKLGYTPPPVNKAMVAAGVIGKTATPLGFLESLGEGAKKAYDKLMNLSTEDIMEGFREIVSGVAGTIGTLILALIPGGNAVNILIYGVLVGWDIMQAKAKSAKFSLFNLILDIFSLILSGVGAAKALKPAEVAKPVVGEIKTIPALFIALESKFPKIYKLLKGFIDTVGKGAAYVLDAMEKGIAWLVQKLPFLAKIGNSLRSGISSVSGYIKAIVEGAGGKVVSQVVQKTAAKIGQASAKLLAMGSAYLTRVGPQIGSKIITGLESKIGSEVAKELDKQALKKIEAYAFENGTATISQLRPGICKMGKSLCDTFDIAMNALIIGKEIKDVYKSGSKAIKSVADVKTAETTLKKVGATAETIKKGVETAEKGVKSYEKIAPSGENILNTVGAPIVNPTPIVTGDPILNQTNT